jgi:hypothetical protein
VPPNRFLEANSVGEDARVNGSKPIVAESAATGLEHDRTQFTNVMIDLAGRAWTAGTDTVMDTLAAVYDVLYPSAEDPQWRVTPTLSGSHES